MFRVENIESPRSGRPVANQFEVIMDTAVGACCFISVLRDTDCYDSAL